ncbi:TPR-like protein [Xylaria sp. FL0933]|nr:TPR-like protein [Xylaria sp. FL0933]
MIMWSGPLYTSIDINPPLLNLSAVLAYLPAFPTTLPNPGTLLLVQNCQHLEFWCALAYSANMTCISEWSISFSHTRLSTALELPEPDARPKRFSILSFLATAQTLGVTILPITWEAARQDVGSGGTSKIHESLANLRTSLAFKRIHEISKQEKTDSELFRILANEVTILSHPIVREHENIAQLQGICWDISPDDGKPWPVLVFEKSQFGDLYDFASLPVGRDMDVSNRIKLCVDIGTALLDMHSCNIIHGDIKPDNILIFKESGRYSAKVIDFGYSTRYTTEDCWLKLPISWPWNAPEHDRPARSWLPSQAVKADVFSFGILCFWLLFESYLSGSASLYQGPKSSMVGHPRSARDALCGIKESVQAYAQRLVKTEIALDDERRRTLAEFFDLTLTSDPQRRETNLTILLRKLDEKQAIHKIDSSVGFEYLPGTANFRIELSVHDLYYCDYRIRAHIAETLLIEGRHDPSLALQLAFCYYIGFGVPGNEDKALTILRDNDFSIQHIHRIRDECIQKRPEHRPATLGKLWDEGYIKRSDYRYAYLDRAKLEEAEDQLLEDRKSLINRFGKDHELVQISLIMASGIYWVRGQWVEVERLESEIVETSSRELGHNHPSTITHMGNLASAYWNQGRLKEAELLFSQLTESGKNTVGPNHVITLTNMSNLATTYWNQSRLDEAEQLFEQVAETRSKVLGPEHPDTLTSMGNLASTYKSQGRWKDAEQLSIQLIERQKRVLEAEHPSTLTSQANLASIYGDQGKWDQAERLLVQIMQVREKKFGPEHPETLVSRANLASIHWNQGQWSKAETLFQQVTESRKKTIGVKHPDTLSSMGGLAATYRNQGRWEEAEQLEIQVTELNSQMLGPDHPDTLTSMANLASTYWKQDRLEEAQKLFTEVVKKISRVLGSEHPDTLTALANLSATYASQHKWSEAERLFLQIVAIKEKVLGAEHPSTLTSMANLASTYGSQSEWIEAVRVFTHVIETRKKVLGVEHPSTLTSMSNLAVIYQRQGLDIEAQRLLAQVAEVRNKLLGAEHSVTAADNLILAGGRLHAKVDNLASPELKGPTE